MANWLDKYEQGGMVLKKKTKDNYGKKANPNDVKASVGPDFVGLGYNTKGRDYSPAWGGQFAMGGSLPGAVGFTYARVAGSAPANGKYTKKTKASAQNGKEMAFYQNGLDFTPKSISKNGSVIKDDRGQWAHPGEITEIGSNNITMQGVDYPVLGVSDTGDTQMMQPNQDYKFDGEKVTEYPMAQDGKKLKNIKGESEKFLKGWMDSPMYNKMVNESIKKSPNTNNEILKQISRQDQLDRMIQNPKSFITGDLNSDKPWYDFDRIEGEYNRDNYNITIDKNIDNDKRFETAVHELSHATDLAGANIPRADVEKMWKYQKQHEQEKGKLTKFFDDEDFNTYVGRPTETRARLNSIRALGKEQGIYNPFTEKIDKSKLDKIKSPNIIRDSQLDQLRKIYNDDQIIDLLNSVSKNDSNKLIPQAQDGGWLNKYK